MGARQKMEHVSATRSKALRTGRVMTLQTSESSFYVKLEVRSGR